MDNAESTLNHRIARRVRDLRATKCWSLETLADKSGVSRSMISLVERGESSPTAVVLEKLAAALDVTLASLFDAPAATKREPVCPLARRKAQTEWRDPESGYLRRNVSPPSVPQPMHIVEVYFPPGARVAFDTSRPKHRVHQQVWMLEGVMEVTVGKERNRMEAGDCLAMNLDQPIMYYNPTRKVSRYAVVIADEQRSKQ